MLMLVLQKPFNYMTAYTVAFVFQIKVDHIPIRISDALNSLVIMRPSE